MLQTQEEVFDDGYLRVEYSHFYIACRGIPIYSISRKEFLILACLLRANGRPVPHLRIFMKTNGEFCGWRTSNFAMANTTLSMTP